MNKYETDTLRSTIRNVVLNWIESKAKNGWDIVSTIKDGETWYVIARRRTATVLEIKNTITPPASGQTEEIKKILDNLIARSIQRDQEYLRELHQSRAQVDNIGNRDSPIIKQWREEEEAEENRRGIKLTDIPQYDVDEDKDSRYQLLYGYKKDNGVNWDDPVVP